MKQMTQFQSTKQDFLTKKVNKTKKKTKMAEIIFHSLLLFGKHIRCPPVPKRMKIHVSIASQESVLTAIAAVVSQAKK